MDRILQRCQIFRLLILAALNIIILKKIPQTVHHQKRSVVLVIIEKMDMATIRTTVAATATIRIMEATVDTVALMEAMVTVVRNMAEAMVTVDQNTADTETTDTNRIMVKVMVDTAHPPTAMEHLTDMMTTINRTEKDTEDPLMVD